MNRMRKVASHVRRAFALSLRRVVQRRTAAALARLDDHALAVIGLRRDRIADFVRDLARRSICVSGD